MVVDVTTSTSLLYGGATVASLDNSCRYASSVTCNNIWTCTEAICSSVKSGSAYTTVTPLNKCYLNTTSAFEIVSQDDILNASMWLTMIVIYGQVVLVLIGLLCQCFCCQTTKWCRYVYLAIVTVSKMAALTAVILFCISSYWLEKGFPVMTEIYGALVLGMLVFLNCVDLIWAYVSGQPKRIEDLSAYITLND